jgi:hypothetical protein
MKKPGMLAIAMMVLAPAGARACAVCMGGNDTNLAPAMNAAIFMMLGCIGFILLSLMAFIIFLARRAARPFHGNPIGTEEARKIITPTESHA